MTNQDQIDYVYPLTYTVVSGDWILKIADKYAIEGVSREERSQQIIEANADFLLPRSGYNTLDELLVGQDWILPGDNLIIPPYILPTEDNQNIEPKILAEYTLCSDADGIIGTLQILQYPGFPNTVEPVAIMKNFPEGYVSTYTFGSELDYSNDYEYLANKFLSEDLNPNLKELNLTGDMRLCNKLPYTIEGRIASAACGSPIEGVLIEDDNGSSTYTDKNGEYILSGTYEPVKNQEGIPPSNILEKESSEFLDTLLPEFEINTPGLPLVPSRPPAYDSTPPELRTLPQKEIVEAEVIDMSRAEIIDAKLIDTSPTPTPINSYLSSTSLNREQGPLPIYEEEEIQSEKTKKRKRKKIKKKRKLGWNLSWPSFPQSKKDRKKFFQNEKDKVKNEREKEDKKEKETEEGKKQKEKREKKQKERIKKNKQPKDNKKNNPPPTIKLGKIGWCRKETPLIGLNGFPRPSLGLIQLEPFDPKFPQLQRPEFVFPNLELKELTLPKINFEMRLQLELNKLQIKLKKNLIPLIGMLLSKFNICNPSKALALLAGGLAFKDLGVSCPANREELLILIEKRNRLTKALNNIYSFLKKVNISVETLDKIVQTVSVASIAAKILTFIPITPVTPLPTATATVVETIDRQLKKYKLLIPGLLSIIALLLNLLAKILQMLSLLDNAISLCSSGVLDDEEELPQELISNELLLATQQQSTQTQPVVTNVNGFEMDVITVDSVEIEGEKRRQAVAKNKAGIIMLRGEASFSSNDQILIDELVFYIQQNDLKAD